MRTIYKLFFVSVIIASFMWGVSEIAFAEEKEDLTFNLEQVVVTATKTLKQLTGVRSLEKCTC